MVQAKGVEVWLESYGNGFRYHEHTAPFGTIHHTYNANEKYVEVGSNERFRIVVKLLEVFKFMGYHKVGVECRVDMEYGGEWLCLKNVEGRAYSESDACIDFDEVAKVIDGKLQISGLQFVKLESGMIPWSIATRS
jgi:hypothetical protein